MRFEELHEALFAYIDGSVRRRADQIVTVDLGTDKDEPEEAG